MRSARLKYDRRHGGRGRRGDRGERLRHGDWDGSDAERLTCRHHKAGNAHDYPGSVGRRGAPSRRRPTLAPRLSRLPASDGDMCPDATSAPGLTVRVPVPESASDRAGRGAETGTQLPSNPRFPQACKACHVCPGHRAVAESIARHRCRDRAIDDGGMTASPRVTTTTLRPSGCTDKINLTIRKRVLDFDKPVIEL